MKIFGFFKKKGESERGAEAPAKERHPDIPEAIQVEVELAAVPERQPARPRSWRVQVLGVDGRGITLSRVRDEPEPLPVAEGELLTLVRSDEHSKDLYDCPVLRVRPGDPEIIVVGPPRQSSHTSQTSEVGERRFLRLETRLPAELLLVRGDYAVEPRSVRTLDLSLTGMALESPASYEAGQPVEVRVQAFDLPLLVRGTVVRSTDHPGGGYRVAVEFPPDLPEVTRDLIADFLHRRLRRGS
ncbi:MAG TPA: PilZ domain-containing protein [Candidatus Nitrosotenuis sp.]|nr:PilZ domain-containing protein [Candidatus Nitrosotenuis sp.]